jgi:hypothetical protein
MATKEQYDFFRSLYEEEERTYEQLEGRAKVYLGVITIFLATVLLKAQDVVVSAHALKISWWVIMLVSLLLLAALALILHALRIRAYEAVNDPIEIINSFQGDGPSDAEFFEDRIADYAVAASRNLKENNDTGYYLAWSGRLLVVSMMILMFAFVFSLAWSMR